ncbi:MAG: hypothetical protein LBV52_07105, partial [Spirochaetaceae bacterium]|nr:hypothetical protein [Spirochaetaceae bacterium]
MKAKLFLIPLLLIIFLSTCVKKQAKPVELPAEEVMKEIIAEPLPPINERLNGTVWVSSDVMWEDIPVGTDKTTYTFTENEFCRVDSQISFYEHETEITLRILIPYSVISNDTIKDEYFSNEEYLSTLVVYDDHIMDNSIYTENSQKVKNGEAYAGEIFRSKKFYPYSAELRDMDYTKDLELDGSKWVFAASPDNNAYMDNSFTIIYDNIVYDIRSEINIAFNRETYTYTHLYGTISQKYEIYKNHIVLYGYY